MEELQTAIAANHITLPENSIAKTLERLNALPYDATSSMSKDFQRGAKTELDSLTAYVTRLGARYGIAIPTYNYMLTALQEKSKRN